MNEKYCEMCDRWFARRASECPECGMPLRRAAPADARTLADERDRSDDDEAEPRDDEIGDGL